MQCLQNRQKYRKRLFGESSSSKKIASKGKGKAKLRKEVMMIEESSVISDNSCDELRDAIKNEMLNQKPRDEVLKPLMKATFNERQSTLSENPISVSLKLYPCLKLASLVS